jgi:hypothetical protein
VRVRVNKTVVIASGQTKSASVRVGDGVPVAIITPAALTGTSLTFEAADGDTFLPLYDAYGNVVTVQIGTSRMIAVEGINFVGAKDLKLVSSAAEGADRTFQLLIRREPS